RREKRALDAVLGRRAPTLAPDAFVTPPARRATAWSPTSRDAPPATAPDRRSARRQLGAPQQSQCQLRCVLVRPPEARVPTALATARWARRSARTARARARTPSRRPTLRSPSRPEAPARARGAAASLVASAFASTAVAEPHRAPARSTRWPRRWPSARLPW